MPAEARSVEGPCPCALSCGRLVGTSIGLDGVRALDAWGVGRARFVERTATIAHGAYGAVSFASDPAGCPVALLLGSGSFTLKRWGVSGVGVVGWHRAILENSPPASGPEEKLHPHNSGRARLRRP